MLKRLARWFAAYAGVMPTIDQTRLNAGTDAVERGARWEQFYREDGGLLDMLEAERRDLFLAMGSLDPKDIEKVYWLATADRIVGRLQNRIEQVVIAGAVEKNNVIRAEEFRAMQRTRLEF